MKKKDDHSSLIKSRRWTLYRSFYIISEIYDIVVAIACELMAPVIVCVCVFKVYC